MKTKIEIRFENRTATLAVSGTDQDVALKRLGDLAELLQLALDGDQARKDLTEDEYAARKAGILAMEMKFHSMLVFSEQQARAYHAVVIGEESVGEHGFPEFSGA